MGLLLLTCVTGCMRTARISRPPAGAMKADQVLAPEARLTLGEKLTFRARWNGIPVGRATATVEEIMPFKGYKVYKVVVVVRTNKVLSTLFKVEDTFTSYIDTTTLTSRHFEGIIREGRYKKDVVVDYDFENSIASYTNLLDGNVKTAPIEKNVHDPISAAYFFRTMPVTVGDDVRLIVNLNEKNYEAVAVIGKKVKVKISRLGSFNAFLVKPYVKLHGKRERRGEAWGYLSCDEKRFCLYLVVKVLEIPWIGRVAATLEKVEYVSPAEN